MFCHLRLSFPVEYLFLHCVLCFLRFDGGYMCTLNRVEFIPSICDFWEQELGHCCTRAYLVLVC